MISKVLLSRSSIGRISGIVLSVATATMTMIPASSKAQTAAVTSGNVEQAAPASSGGLEEIVVTAQRRESNLQSTPIAVSALDGNFIQQVGSSNLGDLANFVPNFAANKVQGFNTAAFAMRGVGATDINQYDEPPVAVLVDDFVMPSPQTQLLDTFDTQEVEVLRGPQGTLFGKNTTGGVISVRTKLPDLEENQIDLRAEAGSFNDAQYQGALDVPLISNQLGLRIVASEERQDGYYRNGAVNTIKSTSQPEYDGTYSGDGSRVGGTNVLSGRAKILWQPTDNFRALAQYELIQDRSQITPVIDETPDAPASFYWAAFGAIPNQTGNPLDRAGVDNRQGYLIDSQDGQRTDVTGMYLNMDWTLEPGTLTSINGYRSQDSILVGDETGNVGPLALFDINREDRRKTWQEELRFASKPIGPFEYVAGAFYQHNDDKFCVAQIQGFLDLIGVPALPGFQPGGYNDNPSVLCSAQRAVSEAVYGEGNYKFADDLTLTVGARWTRETKDWIGRQQVYVQQLNSPTGAFDPAFTWQQLGSLMNAADFSKYSYGVVTDSHTWTEPTYRASLSYQYSPTIYGYGTFSHGFRSGGYNDQVGTTFLPITDIEKKPTNPEKANSFELGVKSEWFERRLRVNEALFYVKYTDLIQQGIVVLPSANGVSTEETLFINAASMTAYGIESEVTGELADGLVLRVPFSYQHCSYNSFNNIVASYSLTNAPVTRCPEFTGTVDLQYEVGVPITSGKVSMNLAANYISKNLYTLSFTNPGFDTYADSRLLLDATATYTGADGHWFIRGLAKNLTNRLYKLGGQDVEPLWQDAIYGAPRTFYAQVGFKFGAK